MTGGKPVFNAISMLIFQCRSASAKSPFSRASQEAM